MWVLLLAEEEAKQKRETRGEGWEEPMSAGPDARLVIVPKRPSLSPLRHLALHIPGSGAQGSGYQQDWGAHACTPSRERKI